MDPTRSRVSSGNGGLDVILRGGLPANRVYLIEGMPGTGKTTLALQFLRAAADAGEPALYITLSETKEELAVVAESHGFDTSGFDVFEFSALNSAFGAATSSPLSTPGK